MGDKNPSSVVDSPLTAGEELITLSCEGTSTTFQVKKSILCSYSNYFERSFSFEDNSEIKFDPKIIPLPTLNLLVKYMQTDELKPTLDNIESLFHAADYLHMDMCLEVLMRFLHDDMATQQPGKMKRSIILIYVRLLPIICRYKKDFGFEYAKIKLVPVLNGADQSYWDCSVYAYGYIAMRFKSVMYEKCVLELPYDCNKGILDINILNIPEEDVARTVKMWINYDFDARKQHFPTLIRCMRFDKTMDLDFIMEELLCYCKSSDCECLSAKDYVIAIIAKRNGYDKDVTEHGPYSEKVRGCYPSWKILN